MISVFIPRLPFPGLSHSRIPWN